MKEEIKVSICCLTYNHESYISDCLEGILNQKTTFNYEILIHDDASQDKTQNIIAQYRSEYPNIIKPIYQKENTYSKEGSGVNLRYNIKRASGKYIAICDGDDYWIGKNKLQSQIEFLESNPSYCLSHTGYYILDEFGNLIEPDLFKSKSLKELDGLLEGNAIVHSSVVYRNSSILSSQPKWLFKCFNLDWALHLILLSDGCKIHFSDSREVVYRQNIGISKENNSLFNLNNELDLKLKLLSDHRFERFESKIFKSIFKTRLKIMAFHNKRRSYGKGLKIFIKILIKSPLKVIRIFLYSLKIGLINKY